ncbi:MAG TPA: MFS transporter [Actinophytocola sp.]|uniref:MFS transporter n=1 Tax=Actinophytocola sp. TaxID=1872138 RepID=UPI002DDD32AC|nr:MFS transporter [Actinophytocola sp.]HEV2778386.1 MFS transporter [Actinophytocola sp.]
MGNEATVSSIAEAQPDPRRWKALAVLCAATFIIILDGSIVFVALPSMAQDLALTPTAVQWVLSAYLLSFGGLLLLGGRVADLVGRRRVFMAGTALLGVSSLLCGLAWSADVLVGARVLQGLSGAIMAPTALSILMNTFPQAKERNKALGFWSSAGGVGGTVGSLLGGPITQGLGWSWIFFINVPVAVLVVALSPVLLRESYDRNRARTLDVAGALTSTVALVLLVWAITDAPEVGWLGARTVWLLVSVVVLVAVFVLIEWRSSAPLMPLHYLRSKGFVGGNLVLVVVGMAVSGGMGFILTQYAQVVLGYSAVQFGLIFSVMTVLTIVGSMLAGGRLGLRFGPRPVAIVALLLIAASCLTFTRIDANGSFVSDILLGVLLFGPGLGAGFVAGNIAALAGVPERDSGLASGVSNATFHIGGALGIAVLATVAASEAAGPDPLTAMTTGFQYAYGVAITFAAAGILAALFLLGRPAKPAVTPVPLTEETDRRAA